MSQLDKFSHISPKYDKSGTFKDQFSVHYGAVRRNVLKTDVQKAQICLIYFF